MCIGRGDRFRAGAVLYQSWCRIQVDPLCEKGERLIKAKPGIRKKCHLTDCRRRVSLYLNGKCRRRKQSQCKCDNCLYAFAAFLLLSLPSSSHPLVMIRRMTDKLGHLTHGHQKPPQQQQPIQTLTLPVTTHTHLEHRGSISTQRTSESSKRGESVDEKRLINESVFPYQRRTKGTYRLSDFYFQRTLGTGSFGRVHLGRPASRPLLSRSHRLTVRSKHNLRFYAIKVLHKEKIVKSKQIDHTNNEQLMLLAVQHPFIINLWGSFQDATNLYMVMDFVPGGELFTLLRRSNVRFLSPAPLPSPR